MAPTVSLSLAFCRTTLDLAWHTNQDYQRIVFSQITPLTLLVKGSLHHRQGENRQRADPRDSNTRQGEQGHKRTERRTWHCLGITYMLCAARSSTWKAKEQLLFSCSKPLQHQLGRPQGYGKEDDHPSTPMLKGPVSCHISTDKSSLKDLHASTTYFCVPASIPFSSTKYTTVPVF